MRVFLSFLLATLALPPALFAQSNAAAPFAVSITVHADQSPGEMTPIWRFFGYDEANYTYMKDGKKLLGELGKLGTPQVFIRCHHLLTSGDGSPAMKWGSTGIYREDANGQPIYDWTIVDRIFDTYLGAGLKPYVEMGFMPEALSTRADLYPHHPPAKQRAPVDAGQAYPPKDYAKWGELMHQWVKHNVDVHGAAEVEQWPWEVWNEPNIFYWHATRPEYFRLYDYAVDGVRRALPTARVGGPETAGGPGGRFLRAFLEHCARGTNDATGKIGAPLDFISFHAKGNPTFVDNHVRMGMGGQLRNIRDAFAVVTNFPEYRNKPLVIGESDPEGCAACRDANDAYRNGTMYSSYEAAVFARKYELADQYGVQLEGALTWAFEFEDQPLFAGFRELACGGLDKPVLNVFRMFSHMSGRRLAVESSAAHDAASIMMNGVRAEPDVSALASLDHNQLCVLAWHYHDDDVPGPDAEVTLALDALPASVSTATVTRYQIDATHCNAYDAWRRLGSPQPPTAEQYAQLEAAGQLTPFGPDEPLAIAAGKATLHLTLPRQAVTLFVVKWN